MWGKVLIWAWIATLSYSGIRYNLPASWWFQPGPIIISDAAMNECPALSFDRDINRPFHAEWVVTIMRQRPGGGFSTYKTFRGENDYRPENNLPDDPELCWWSWVDELNLPAGKYRVHTLWVLNLTHGGERQVRRSSNVFQITP